VRSRHNLQAVREIQSQEHPQAASEVSRLQTSNNSSRHTQHEVVPTSGLWRLVRIHAEVL